MISGLLLALQLVTAPWPDTLSRTARDGLAADTARPPAGPSMAARRDRAVAIQRDIGARQRARYGVTMTDRVIAGVPVRVFTPRGGGRGDAILLNLHGGGFVVDSGSITENVPIAALTQHVVIAVPVALGFFSGTGDLTAGGDSATLFLNAGAMRAVAALYAGPRDPADPALSPARGSLGGWPATLCVSSTRDFLLSATADFCRRLDTAYVDARLIVHDGLPHAFWSYVEAPESDAAFATMARFLRRQLETRR